ncbi:type II toxin-antitoxin system MqsA family antitoxin [Pseudomonas aeruginosa]|nr:type II toxin-antitoxin system MqsA family antitoxin [Pseudomonas aeruginosa]EIU2707771.1 type II toxin-antitoxin system MqsA family antitoxin [Pseudomonas aeruginosa]EIU5250874.1 type II toxin-antitoxin system MqsA family antitoxin [Pseudomonas aeruginosa]EKJ9723491.1 type II toxin-antitoxin system MqsA family antitoxin [Pseudomonas aeruginosa]EKU4549396.1 type II toxin-antitoxin system MqsA family antitoxin [Pseudomonas aeruginosa]EKW8363016.1 type II toxin-antitoxin system MqsA family an
MKNLETCPVCCSGVLRPYTFSKEISYKNVTCSVEVFQSSRCETCESEVALHAQSKHNKLISINFQRAVDGLLTTTEIIRIRKKLGLSQRAASQLIGGGGNAFAKYESGATKQSVGIDNMLKVLDQHPKIIKTLIEADQQRKALTSAQVKICIPSPREKAESGILTFVKDCFGFSSPTFDTAVSDSNSTNTITFANRTSISASWSL